MAVSVHADLNDLNSEHVFTILNALVHVQFNVLQLCGLIQFWCPPVRTLQAGRVTPPPPHRGGGTDPPRGKTEELK